MQHTKFFFGFPMEKFSFVGITEFFDEDMEFLSKEILNRQLPIFKERVGDRNINYKIVDHELRKKIEKFHDRDMALYFNELEKRKKRYIN